MSLEVPLWVWAINTIYTNISDNIINSRTDRERDGRYSVDKGRRDYFDSFFLVQYFRRNQMSVD